MIIFHFIIKMLKNPILKVNLSRFLKMQQDFWFYKLSCKYMIIFFYFQVSGGLEDIYVLPNCAYYSHNILNV
jgi:hypothetical protein